MLKEFNATIKKRNNELGVSLGIKNIEVKDLSREVRLDVRITYTSHSGHRVTRLAGRKEFYRALGLVI